MLGLLVRRLVAPQVAVRISREELCLALSSLSALSAVHTPAIGFDVADIGPGVLGAKLAQHVAQSNSLRELTVMAAGASTLGWSPVGLPSFWDAAYSRMYQIGAVLKRSTAAKQPQQYAAFVKELAAITTSCLAVSERGFRCLAMQEMLASLPGGFRSPSDLPLTLDESVAMLQAALIMTIEVPSVETISFWISVCREKLSQQEGKIDLPTSQVSDLCCCLQLASAHLPALRSLIASTIDKLTGTEGSTVQFKSLRLPLWANEDASPLQPNTEETPDESNTSDMTSERDQTLASISALRRMAEGQGEADPAALYQELAAAVRLVNKHNLRDVAVASLLMSVVSSSPMTACSSALVRSSLNEVLFWAKKSSFLHPLCEIVCHRLQSATPSASKSGGDVSLATQRLPRALLRRRAMGLDIGEDIFAMFNESNQWDGDECCIMIGLFPHRAGDLDEFVSSLILKCSRLGESGGVTLAGVAIALPVACVSAPSNPVLERLSHELLRCTSSLLVNDEFATVEALAPLMQALSSSLLITQGNISSSRLVKDSLLRVGQEAVSVVLARLLTYRSTSNDSIRESLLCCGDIYTMLRSHFPRSSAEESFLAVLEEIFAGIVQIQLHQLCDPTNHAQPNVVLLHSIFEVFDRWGRIDERVMDTAAGCVKRCLSESPLENTIKLFCCQSRLAAPELEHVFEAALRSTVARADWVVECSRVPPTLAFIALFAQHVRDLDTVSRCCRRMEEMSDWAPLFEGDVALGVEAVDALLACERSPALRDSPLREAIAISCGKAARHFLQHSLCERLADPQSHAHLKTMTTALSVSLPYADAAEVETSLRHLTTLVPSMTASMAVKVVKAVAVCSQSEGAGAFLVAACHRLTHWMYHWTPVELCDAVHHIGNFSGVGALLAHHVAMQAVGEFAADNSEVFHSGPAIARMLLGFSKAHITTRNLYYAFAMRLKKRPIFSSISKPSDVSNALEAFGAVKFVDKALFDMFGRRLLRSASSLGADDVVAAACAFSRTMLLHEQLYSALGNRASIIAKEIPAASIAVLLSAFGHVGVHHQVLGAAVMEHLNVDVLSATEATKMLVGLWQMGHRDATGQDFDKLANHIAAVDANGVDQKGLMHLCSVAQDMQWRHSKMLQAIANQSCRLIAEDSNLLSKEAARAVLDTMSAFSIHHTEARQQLTPSARTVSRETVELTEDEKNLLLSSR